MSGESWKLRWRCLHFMIICGAATLFDWFRKGLAMKATAAVVIIIIFLLHKSTDFNEFIISGGNIFAWLLWGQSIEWTPKS